MQPWDEYQEEVADFFRQLGFESATNVTLSGVRTAHDIDVVVRSRRVGLEVTWLVECKAWQTRVPKEKVLAFRSIVDDCGADRGVMMAENGYQSGALEAARNSNVVLTSLKDLREIGRYELGEAQLRTLLPRVITVRERYWKISKDHRIEFGLRPEPLVFGYSGNRVAEAVQNTILYAITSPSAFPLGYSELRAALSNWDKHNFRLGGDATKVVENPWDLFTMLDAELGQLEARLTHAEDDLGRRKSS